MHSASVRELDGGEQVFRLERLLDPQKSAAGRDVLGGGDQLPLTGPDPRLELHFAARELTPMSKKFGILPVHAMI